MRLPGRRKDPSPACAYPACRRPGNQVLHLALDGRPVSVPVCGVHGEGVQLGIYTLADDAVRHALARP